MSDEMKLLMAMCDALGFEVEIIKDYQKRTELVEAAKLYISLPSLKHSRRLTSTNGKYDIDEYGFYTSMLTDPVLDFKLTKK